MLRNLFIGCFCFWTSFCLGQQLPLHSTNQDFMSSLNPAAVNNYFLLRSKSVNTLSLFHREQWADSFTNGDPQTSGVNTDWWIKKRYKVGGHFLSDKAGAINSNNISGRFSIDLWDSGNSVLKSEQGTADRGSLHLGLGVNYGFFNIDRSKIDERDWNDPLLGQNNFSNTQSLGAIVGLFGHRQLNKGPRKVIFFGGLSFHQFRFSVNGFQNEQQIRHYYVHPGFIFEVSKKPKGNGVLHFLEASSLLQMIENAPFNANFNLRHHLHFNGQQGNTITYGFGYVKNSWQAEFLWFLKGKYGGGFNVDFLDKYRVGGMTIEARILVVL